MSKETFEKTVLDRLKRIKKLLTPPEAWTKGVDARVKRGGAVVAATDSQATCFCVIGAVLAVTKYYWFSGGSEGRDNLQLELVRRISEEVKLTSPTMRQVSTYGSAVIAKWNDRRSTTHKDVLNLLGRVIKNFNKKKSTDRAHSSAG